MALDDRQHSLQGLSFDLLHFFPPPRLCSESCETDVREEVVLPMNRMTVVLVCLLCSSIGFSVGQVVDQSAEAGQAQTSATDRAVVKQLKRLYRLQFESQIDIVLATRDTARKVEAVRAGLDQVDGKLDGGPLNHDAGELLYQICRHTDPGPGISC